MKIYLVVAIAAAVAVASCGSEAEVGTASEVRAAFEGEGFTLIDSNLYGDEDDLSALYSGSDPMVDAYEPVLFVAVFADEETAKRYSVAEASPLADGGDVEYRRNVVLYLKRGAPVATAQAARRALARV